IANFGLEAGEPGPLQRLDPKTGALEILAGEAEGRRLSTSNFASVASDGTVYCTHSTWASPMSAVGRDTTRDGFVYRVDGAGRVDIVARGIHFANGCCFDADESHLYVVQSFAPTLLRYRRLSDGRLGEPEPFGPALGEIPEHQIGAELLARMSPQARSR